MLWFNDADGMLFGIQLFTEKGEKVLQTHYNFESKRSKEVRLEADERIIGFVAASYSQTHAAYYDFQFVIGSLE